MFTSGKPRQGDIEILVWKRYMFFFVLEFLKKNLEKRN